MSDEEYDIHEVTQNAEDDYLLGQLRQHGLNPGPITDTTRTTYKKMLEKILRTGNPFSEPDEDEEAEDHNQFAKIGSELKSRAATEAKGDIGLVSSARHEYFGSDYIPSARAELAYHRRVLNAELQRDPLSSASLGSTTGLRSYSSSRPPGDTSRVISNKRQGGSQLTVITVAVALIIVGILLFIVFFVE